MAAQTFDDLVHTAHTDGSVRVIAKLYAPSMVPEAVLRDDRWAVLLQRLDIVDLQEAALYSLAGTAYEVVWRYATTPYMALRVTPDALLALAASPFIEEIAPDFELLPQLAESGPFIQATDAHATGMTGQGQTIVVVDDGIDRTHPFFAGRIVEEWCTVSAGGGCPNGVNGAGAASPVGSHGTHVAGIAAGAGSSFSGVAPGAGIIAIRVFPPSGGATFADVKAALDRVIVLKDSRTIAAVNMSLGATGVFTSACDGVDAPYGLKSDIDTLRAAGIATVVATGNSGSTTGVSYPACISSAIKAGATTKTGSIATYSDLAPAQESGTLLAPGGEGSGSATICSARPAAFTTSRGDCSGSGVGGNYAYNAGTSMAAPHVTGAWAVLKQVKPTATVTEILSALRSTGVVVIDAPTGAAYRRIRVRDALTTLTSLAVGMSANRTSPQAAGTTIRFTATSSGGVAPVSYKWRVFDGTTWTVVQNWSTSTVLDWTPATGATYTVAVWGRSGTSSSDAADGPAASASMAFSITNPAPALSTIAPSAVIAGSAGFTLTVTGSNFVPGSAVRWNGSGRATTFVSATQVRATITAGDIASGGTASVTVFNAAPGGGTSGAQTVTITNPAPSISALSPSSVVAGGAGFTLTVSGSGFVPTSTVRWNNAARSTSFVSSSRLTAVILASDIPLVGGGTVTVVNTTPGGGSATATLRILPPPVLTLDRAVIGRTGPLTVTFGNGPGERGEWFAIYPLGAVATASYVDWQWSSGGQGTYVAVESGMLTLPTAGQALTPGQYTVRWIAPDGRLIAQSSTLAVVDIPPSPSLASLEPAAVVAGSSAFVLRVRGSGFTASSVVQVNGSARTTAYVSASDLTVAIAAGDVAAAGTVAVAVTTPAVDGQGGGTSAVTSLVVTPAPTAPTLSAISPASVAVGATATLAVTGTDFVAASVVHVNGSARATTFLSATQLQATLVAADVAVAGTAAVTVVTPAPGGGTSAQISLTVLGPTLTLDHVTAASGDAIRVTFANGPGGRGEWLAVYALGATTYTDWQWTNGGQGTASGASAGTLTFPSGARPLPPGSYVVRWWGTSARIAESGVFTVVDVAPGGAVMEWARVTDLGGRRDDGRAVAVDADDNVVIGATSGSTPSAGVLLGVGRDGTERWRVLLTAADSSVTDVVRTPGENRVFVSGTDGGAFLGQLDATGQFLFKVSAPIAGTLRVAGSRVFIGNGARVVATDFSGNLVSDVTVPSPDSVRGFWAATDHLVIAGPLGTASWVRKLDLAGALLWERMFDGVAHASVVEDGAGAIYVAGTAAAGYLVVKLDPQGDELWRRTWNGDAADTQGSATAALLLTPAGGVAVVGRLGVAADFGAWGVGADGTTHWTLRQDLDGSPSDVAASGAFDSTGRLLLVGTTVPSPTGNALTDDRDVAVAKFFLAPPPPPAPTLTSIAPTSLTTGTSTRTVAVTGTGFVADSVVRVDGGARPTTYESATQLRVVLSDSDVATAATRALTVFTPAPGGGTSSAVNLTVIGPTIALDRTTAPLTGPLVATIANGPAVKGEWLGLYVAGSGPGAGGYADWQWTNGGQGASAGAATGALTWPTGGRALPAGTYVLRWWAASGALLAQSAVITLADVPPAPAIIDLAPPSVVAGSDAFTLTVRGTGFRSTSVIRIGGAARATTFVSAESLTTAIAASEVASTGTLDVTVSTPAVAGEGGGVSSAATLAITAPPAAPTLTSIAPTSLLVGASTRAVTVTGAGFVRSSVVQVNGSARPTTFTSATSLTATLTTGDVAAGGTLSVRVMTPAPGGGTSSAASLTVVGPTLTLDRTTAPLNGPVVTTLTNGPGVSGEWVGVYRVGGTGGYVDWQWTSGGQGARVGVTGGTLAWPSAGLSLPAGDYVLRWWSAASTLLAQSATFTLADIPPAPTIGSLDPGSVAAGSAAFTLTVRGTGFRSTSVIRIGGVDRATGLAGAEALTTSIAASEVASTRTLSVTVVTPPVVGQGGGQSSAATLSVTAPPDVPVLTSLAPTSLAVGATARTVIATGANFVPSSVVHVDGVARPTTYTAVTQLSVALTAADVASAGTRALTVVTPAPGGGTSGRVDLTVVGPTLTLDRTTAALAGPVAITLANGPGVKGEWLGIYPAANVGGSYVDWQWSSGGQSAIEAATSGSLTFPTGGRALAAGSYVARWWAASGALLAQSAAFTLADIPPAPTINRLDPARVVVAGGPFTLAVRGTGFRDTSVIRIGGVDRATAYGSAESLTTAIAASEIAATGTLSVTVFTPAVGGQGGGQAGAATLTITPPPTLTLDRTAASLVGPVVVTLASGPGVHGEWLGVYPADTVGAGGYVDWQWSNGGQTTIVATTAGALTFPTAGRALAAGSYVVRWWSPSGARLAQSARFTLADIPPAPAITRLDPTDVVAGAGAFTLTVRGTGFRSTSAIRIGGVERTTTYGGAESVSTAIAASEIATAGSLSVTVVTPSVGGQGGGASGGAALAITPPPPAPTLTSLAPTSLVAGATSRTVTVTGTEFVATSVVQVDGVARATAYVSPTELRATLTDADVAAGGTRALRVVTPAPGGGTSSAVDLAVVTPSLTLAQTAIGLTGPVSMTLDNGPGTPGEWVAIYPAANPVRPSGYVDWQWSNGGQSTIQAATSGSLRFPTYAGQTLPAGGYVARWWSASGALIAQSAVFTVLDVLLAPAVVDLAR